MKKTIFSAAIAMFAFTASFASTTDKDATASTAKTEVKTDAKASHTYWVTGRNLDGTYSLSQVEQEGCGEASVDPCKITTDDDFDATLKIDQSKVDMQDGVTIEDRRAALN